MRNSKVKTIANFVPLLVGLNGVFIQAQEPQLAAPRYVIVQPGYAGSSRDAESFVSSLNEHLAEKVALKNLQGEYFNEPQKGLDAIARVAPAFGIVSLGFYLEHRQALGLSLLLQARPRDNWVLVVRPGEGIDARSLKGKAVAGGPLHELKFLERVAFAGKADPKSWDGKPVLQVSRALRDLVNKKTLAAVVLTGRDYRALSALYGPKTLEIAAESAYYAPALLVAFGSKPGGSLNSSGGASGKKSPDGTSEKNTVDQPSEETANKVVAQNETAKKVARVFSELALDPKGKKILETMGAEGFEELAAEELKVLGELEERYAAQEKK